MYEDLCSKKTIDRIKRDFDFRFSKSLGQNFLLNKTVASDIVEAMHPDGDDTVIEIGPGIGTLTQLAAQKVKKVYAVEIDSHLIPVLNETLKGYDNVEIINADILKLDVETLIPEEGRLKVIGNLPYYITTPIIMNLLKRDLPIESITVMMQKEVAERLKAAPGGKSRGGVSVISQYFSEISKVTDVSKHDFMPMPKVDSTVLKLSIRESAPVELKNRENFFRIVKAGFAQRRKTLLNCLSAGLALDKQEVRRILEAADIETNRRAETLSLEEFAKLENLFSKANEGGSN